MEGRYGSTNEAVPAAHKLLDEDETKLEAIRAKLTYFTDVVLPIRESYNGDEISK